MASVSLFVFGYTGKIYLGVILLLSIAWLVLCTQGFKTKNDEANAKSTEALAKADELWARHSRTAYAVAIGILRDSARADQAVSEAFLEAFSVANQFVPGELTVLAWLTRLTRRHAEAMIVPAA